MKYLAFFIVSVVLVVGGYSIFAPRHFSVEGDLMVVDENQCNLEIVVYSTQTCPYCVQAKRLLQANNLDYREVDLMKDREAARKLQLRTGQSYVPQVFINKVFIGGFTELNQWVKSTEYKNYIKACGPKTSS